MPYIPSAILFDGTTDFMLRGGVLTGALDGTDGIFSALVRTDGGDGLARAIFIDNASRVRIDHNSVNQFRVTMVTSAGATILLVMSSAYLAGAAYRHLLVSWSLVATPVVHLYVDDVSDLAVTTTLLAGDIDYTRPEWGVGARTTGAGFYPGAFADPYFAPGQFLDFSVVANRRKYIDAAGNPVFLGVSGEEPTGNPANVYLRGAQTDQGLNSGTGGDFTSQATQVPGETAGPVALGSSAAVGLADDRRFHELESDAGYLVGPAFRMGSNRWDTQFVAPGALCSIEGSNDKANWRIMTDAVNTPISALSDAMRVGRTLPKWLRFVVAPDTMSARLFTTIIQDQKIMEGK